MKSKYKPFKNLFFQFVVNTSLENKLNWYHVAEALLSEGLIKLVPDISGEEIFKGYFETSKMKKINKDVFFETIRGILEKYTNENLK